MGRCVRVGGRLVAAVAIAVALAASPATAHAADEAADGSDTSCEWPSLSWDDLTSGETLTCNAKRVATFIAWVGGGALVLYLAAALALRPISLTANAGKLGTLRRARERLPLVGRTYRPRIELEVTDVEGACGPLARSVHELLIAEMTPASDDAWFRERLTGEGISDAIGKVLDAGKSGLGDVSSFLARRLPQIQRHVRVQLHQPAPHLVTMTVEVLDAARRTIHLKVFESRRVTDDDTADHYLLIRPAAAWLAFQLYDVWPGEADRRPKPVNTDNADSFGRFRQGELLEQLDRPEDARTSYHRAISADPHNVGALLNVALLDSRDRKRCEWSKARLSDARELVDGIDSVRERTKLLVMIQNVRAVASLNRLMWQDEGATGVGDPARAARRRAALAEPTSNIQELARSIRRLTSLPEATYVWRKEREQRELVELAASYKDRAIALVACLAVEYGRAGITIDDSRPGDIVDAIDLVATGTVLSFEDCRVVLDVLGAPITTDATYMLACGLARANRYDRRTGAGPATDYLRDALGGDRSRVPWALGGDGDPAFAALRRTRAFVELRAEFGTSPAGQVAAAATKM